MLVTLNLKGRVGGLARDGARVRVDPRLLGRGLYPFHRRKHLRFHTVPSPLSIPLNPQPSTLKRQVAPQGVVGFPVHDLRHVSPSAATSLRSILCPLPFSLEGLPIASNLGAFVFFPSCPLIDTETLDPNPESLIPKPSTVKPQPSLNPKP
jgi:hypothetical protein